MPSGFLNADIQMPDLTDAGKDVETRLKETQDYLYLLLENLRYTLNNLEPGNFNEAGLKAITDPINARIADADGRLTQLALTAEGLELSVQGLENQTTVYVDENGLLVENGTGQQVYIGNGAVAADFFYGNAYYNSAGTAYLMMDTWGGNLAAMKLYDATSQSNFFTIWKDSTHVGFGTVPSGGLGQQIADYDTATTTLTFMCNVAGVVATFGA